MKKLILLLAAALLISCGSSHQKYVVRDPIFHDQENYIIYDTEKGKQGYLIRDPILGQKHGFKNFLVFDGSGRPDVLLEDPIFPGNYLLYERKGGDRK